MTLPPWRATGKENMDMFLLHALHTGVIRLLPPDQIQHHLSSLFHLMHSILNGQIHHPRSRITNFLSLWICTTSPCSASPRVKPMDGVKAACVLNWCKGALRRYWVMHTQITSCRLMSRIDLLTITGRSDFSIFAILHDFTRVLFSNYSHDFITTSGQWNGPPDYFPGLGIIELLKTPFKSCPFNMLPCKFDLAQPCCPLIVLSLHHCR